MTLGDVHWVDLPDPGGREQSGRRPAVIWQDAAAFPQLPTTLVIPLSSQLGALRFGGTLLNQPSPANGLSLPSVALVFQLGACDVRRIGQRLGRLSDQDLASLRGIARKLQGLERSQNLIPECCHVDCRTSPQNDYRRAAGDAGRRRRAVAGSGRVAREYLDR